MLKTMWKGPLTFGMVMIPIQLSVAVDEENDGFHQVHPKDMGRIKYARICQVCGETIAYADLGKAMTMPDGSLELITDDDQATLDAAKGGPIREAEVLAFVREQEVDMVLPYKSYYTSPGQGGDRAYELFRQALARQKKVAVVTIKMTSVSKPTLAIVRPQGRVLMLTRCYWPEQVRKPDLQFLELPAPKTAKEDLTLAGQLIEAMTREFDPAAFRNDYAKAVEALSEQKIAASAGKPAKAGAKAVPAAAGSAPNIADALRASLAKQKKPAA